MQIRQRRVVGIHEATAARDGAGASAARSLQEVRLHEKRSEYGLGDFVVSTRKNGRISSETEPRVQLNRARRPLR